MEFGQTLVIGGLISTKQGSNIDSLPIANEVPYISRLYQIEGKSEKQLVVLVTPRRFDPTKD